MQIRNLTGNIVTTKAMSWLEVSAHNNDKIKEKVGAYVVSTMLGRLPREKIDTSQWNHLKKLKLADPKYNIPDTVDVLLGAEFYSRVIENGVRKKRGAPTAQKTSFGWIVFGGYTQDLVHASLVNVAESTITNEQLSEMLTKFWEREHTVPKQYRTQEEQLCEDIFTRNITVTPEGRYSARMPLQPNAPKIENTYELTYARLRQMEKRFARDVTLRENYTKFMKEYMELKHMIPVSENDYKSNKAIYIPHHAAGTSKFRTVFDGSCKKKGHLSPNEIQLNGEKIQAPLTTTLMRFRTHKVALTGDITKMYRQILISEDQRDMQRILWRETPEQPIGEYQLITQTYGMKSAAYVCIRVLDHCADEFAKEFPNAAATVKKSFYVDDMLGGTDNAKSAIALHDELSTMLGRRGLELAKWSSNDKEVLQHIRSNGHSLIELNKEETNAVLGIHWNPSTDEFQYQIKNELQVNHPTKRTIASDIARLYDPCGFIACIIVTAKILIQDLWRSSTDWDEEITGTHLQQWHTLCKELTEVTQIRIPRWTGTRTKSKKQIHGFSDASKLRHSILHSTRE